MSHPWSEFPKQFLNSEPPNKPTLDSRLAKLYKDLQPEHLGPPLSSQHNSDYTDTWYSIMEGTNKLERSLYYEVPELPIETLPVPDQVLHYTPKLKLTGPGSDRYQHLMFSLLDQVVSTPTPTFEHTDGITHPAETQLSRLFAALLDDVHFNDALVRMRKSKPVINADKFRFVPVVDGATKSMLSYQVQVPAGIRTTYKERGGLPYLDTPRAIGLVYDDWLVAVGGAQIDLNGRLTVKQLQDVTSVRKATDPERFAQTGLRNGFWWRDTLVAAWEQIGRQLGATEVAIQANQNSTWSRVRNADGRGYDDVARRMHYDQDPSTGNWVKQLGPADRSANKVATSDENV